MTEPTRWSETGSDATRLEQELVLAGQQVRMPESQKQAVWSSIASRLPPVTAPAGAEGSAATAGSAAASAAGPVVKALVVLAVVGGGVGLGLLRGSPSSHVPEPRSVVAAPSASSQGHGSAERSEASHKPKAPVASARAPLPAQDGERTVEARTPSAGAPAPISSLREESQALLEARQAARAGDASRALGLLERARRRFPNGTLGQEREALTIEVLAQSGAAAAAKQRAELFLRAHPRSPHAADVRNIAGR